MNASRNLCFFLSSAISSRCLTASFSSSSSLFFLSVSKSSNSGSIEVFPIGDIVSGGFGAVFGGDGVFLDQSCFTCEALAVGYLRTRILNFLKFNNIGSMLVP